MSYIGLLLRMKFISTFQWQSHWTFSPSITCNSTIAIRKQRQENNNLATIQRENLIGHFSMVQGHGPTSMVWLLKHLVLKALGPSLGVNKCGPRRMTMHQKVNVLVFLNTCPQRAVLKKNQVWPFSCLLLGFTCFHFLLNMSRMWLANLRTRASEFVHV